MIHFGTVIFALKPTREEENLLEEHFKKGPSTLVRARAQAILLSAEGTTVPRIAVIVRYSVPIVRAWLHAWNERRMSSIFHEYTGNTNASKLTKEQREEIKQTLGKPPSEQGLSGSFWSLPSLKRHLKTEFGVIYESDRSYHYLLKHSGYSWKLPSPFDIRRDEEQIRARMKEIHKELEPYMQDPKYVVLAADETRINWEEEVRRAWLKKGEKTVIKLKRDKTGQSYFGALNMKTGKEHLIPLAWQNSDEIIKSLVKLKKKYPDKKLCILWDNAGWHKSKKLRDELKEDGKLSDVHLIQLPPYAPDMNPEEHVWKYGKEQLANTHFDTFDALRRRFKRLLNNKTFDYKIPTFVLR